MKPMSIEQIQDGLRIISRERVKKILLLKYKSLTNAANFLGIKFNSLSNVIHGRHYTIYVIVAIQKDLGLTNEQVLEFWPLLGTWPKEGRRKR